MRISDWSSDVCSSDLIGPCAQLLLAEAENLQFIRYFFPDVIIRIEVVPALIDIAELDRRADVDLAAVGLFLAGDELEQGRFAGTVRPDHADDAARSEEHTSGLPSLMRISYAVF